MRRHPVLPPDGTGVSAIAIGSGTFHTCAIVGGGGVKCWGYNYYGQLGIGSTVNQYRPVDVPGVTMHTLSCVHTRKYTGEHTAEL